MNDLIAWVQLHPATYAIPGVFFLNLLLGKKSQIDAWCEANPNRAAVVKALRGVMPDPWLLLQAASLLLTKRLPKWPA